MMTSRANLNTHNSLNHADSSEAVDHLEQEVNSIDDQLAIRLDTSGKRIVSIDNLEGRFDLVAGNVLSPTAHGYFLAPENVFLTQWKKSFDSVYRMAPGANLPGGGSAALISSDGILLTAGHVVEPNEWQSHVLTAGREVIPLDRARLLNRTYRRFDSQSPDIALLHVPQLEGRPHLEISGSKPENGAVVAMVGYPEQLYMGDNTPAFGTSYPCKLIVGTFQGIPKICRFEGDDWTSFSSPNYYKFSVLNLGGNSGGPLLNLEGKIVSLASMGSLIGHGKALEDIQLSGVSLMAIHRILGQIGATN